MHAAVGSKCDRPAYCGQSCADVLSISDLFAGGSADWARSVSGIRYSYLVELRDTGTHGFRLPVSQILPTGCEAWVGVRELAAHALLNDGFTRPAPPPPPSLPCDTRSNHVTSCRNNHGQEQAAAAAILGEPSSSGARRILTSISYFRSLLGFSLMTPFLALSTMKLLLVVR